MLFKLSAIEILLSFMEIIQAQFLQKVYGHWGAWLFEV